MVHWLFFSHHNHNHHDNLQQKQDNEQFFPRQGNPFCSSIDVWHFWLEKKLMQICFVTDNNTDRHRWPDDHQKNQNKRETEKKQLCNKDACMVEQYYHNTHKNFEIINDQRNFVKKKERKTEKEICISHLLRKYFFPFIVMVMVLVNLDQI